MVMPCGPVSRILVPVILLSILLSLSACSGTSGVNQVTDPATILAKLPVLPTAGKPRTAATPYTTELTGLETCERGGDWSEFGTTLNLLPATGSTSWGMYELSTCGYELISAAVRLNTAAGQAFVAVSDYDAACWRIVEGTEGIVDLPVSEASMADWGDIYVAVLATDESDVRVNWVSLTLDVPGWTIYAVEQEPGVGGGVDLFIQDGLPMMAYMRNVVGSTGVRFARATVPLPSSASSWQTMILDYATIGEEFTTPLAAASIDGLPTVIWREYEEQLVLYARAITTEPDGPEDWVTTTVYDSPDTIGFQLGLTECVATPRIAISEQGGPVLLASTLTAQPTQLDWSFCSVVAEEVNARWPALTSVDNKPVLAMSTDVSGTDGLHVGYAPNHTPPMPSAWDIVPAHTGATVGGHASISLQSFGEDQRPVISYLTGYYSGLLYVARPTVTAPASAADWVRCRLEGFVSANDIAVTASGPFVVYYHETEAALKCAGTTNAEFEVQEDFDIFTLQEGCGAAIGSLAAASSGYVPMIAYFDYDAQQLKFGFFTD